MQGYLIPDGTFRSEIERKRSRFITTISHGDSVDKARALIATIRSEMQDASHHVYAFRIGFGNSIIEGMSDDGEPTGTAAPPIMALLRGKEGIGDIAIVVTRYFGGQKLGKGGLVRAYADAAKTGLDTVIWKQKQENICLRANVTYSQYHTLQHILSTTKLDINIVQEEFSESVLVTLIIAASQRKDFEYLITEATAGQIKFEYIKVDTH